MIADATRANDGRGAAAALAAGAMCARAGNDGRRPRRPLAHAAAFLALLLGLSACSAGAASAVDDGGDAAVRRPADGRGSTEGDSAHARPGADASPGPGATTAGERSTAPTAAAAAPAAELARALALIDSEPAHAAEALDALADRTTLIDDVLLYYGAAARRNDQAGQARARLEKLLATVPDSVLVTEAVALLGELVERQGDRGAAVALADRYGRNGPAGPAAARACLAAGRLSAPADAARAALYFACARAKGPLSPEGRAAYEALTALRRDHAQLQPRSAAEWIAEARQLGREARSAEQMAALDRLFAAYPGSPYESEAVSAYGRALAATSGKSAAADFLEKRCARAPAGPVKARWLYEAATFRWNDNHDAEALLLFRRMTALRSGIAEEGEAYYAIARIQDAAGRHAQAIADYELAATRTRGATRVDSQWRQGWVAYRARQWEDAERRFARMASRATPGSDDEGRAEALYWQARSLERLGRAADATPLYRKVLAEFPIGYYSLMAERRLGIREPDGGGSLRTAAIDGPRQAALPGPARRALDRAVLLDNAGLDSLAARDLAARLGSFDDVTRRSLMPALQRVGAYDASFRIAAQLQKSGKLSREEARPYLYPRAHSELVVTEATKAGIDPLLVYALMRQESAFSAQAVSPADALGLMQLLPSTAGRVAAAAGMPPPSRRDLFEPSVNIRLGVRYLSDLSRLFGGNTALVAAAYNAGETAAQRWQGLAVKYDEDEMIEQISYRETRAYVKSVLRNLRTYRRLYGEARPASSARART